MRREDGIKIPEHHFLICKVERTRAYTLPVGSRKDVCKHRAGHWVTSCVTVTRCLPSLCLSFFVCKTGVMVPAPLTSKHCEV